MKVRFIRDEDVQTSEVYEVGTLALADFFQSFQTVQKVSRIRWFYSVVCGMDDSTLQPFAGLVESMKGYKVERIHRDTNVTRVYLRRVQVGRKRIS